MPCLSTIHGYHMCETSLHKIILETLEVVWATKYPLVLYNRSTDGQTNQPNNQPTIFRILLHQLNFARYKKRLFTQFLHTG